MKMKKEKIKQKKVMKKKKIIRKFNYCIGNIF